MRWKPLPGAVFAAAILLCAVAPAVAGPTSTAGTQLPIITPTPHQEAANGAPLPVAGPATVLVGNGADAATKNVVATALTAAGATRVTFADLGARPGPGLAVVVGLMGDAAVATALRSVGGQVPTTLPAEGYSLADRGRLAVLAGNDPDGVFYAAQTFSQLTGPHRIASVSIVDYPLMPLRGTIEGFYGAPWSQSDRLDQLAMYGRLKMNTYVYTPKDDPYLRDQWRDPYPAANLAQLSQLVQTAEANHVRFTFALAPGLSICYSDPSDITALENKLASVYAIGVRSFYVSLDDISYTSWNCAADQTKYGAPSAGAAAAAQVDLLNTVQHGFLDAHAGAQPLQFVPTEYSDLTDSPYKKELRENLDPRIVVQWTGTDVVPPSITVAQARAADTVWGRKVFVWDNYPVDDYGQTTGRLLLAPYDKREAGLHDELSGLVINPMNQASASKVAEFGAASFTWNDENYDAQRTWVQAADYFSHGDPATTTALLAFFDTEHAAPTFGDTFWQPQAPVLAAKIDAFDKAWPTDKQAAVAQLSGYADVLATASAQIRAHVTDAAFLTETAPWLDALQLWGRAFEHTLSGLRFKAVGANSQAQREFAASASLAGKAAAIQTIPGTTRPQGAIRVADGVLDVFLKAAPTM
ncbi:beta-N-acetylhexosaminidase family protein [Kutzneria sp. CA-103260]|uniref:beta-N-acetylhexosaminidase family protein n=1 Tax=Kutzneria sp. CA-103260 TaxID=2802641 RepID=UPI001BA8462D|nr:beta-N-acetylglucosaminidase domain-containing protein [Kutzneria sp. CA-103260]QUQ64423.1 O-GlcNAcase NagJ [Kutzneria sp. CA-103260]